MTPSLLTAIALVLAAPAPKMDPKKDPPPVVGEWVAEKYVNGGEEAILPGRLTWDFTADGKVRINIPEGGKNPDPFDYVTDSKKIPAEIDIAIPDRLKTASTLGIFKVEGDTLMLCVGRGNKRPDKFESPAGSDVTLMTFKRADKK